MLLRMIIATNIIKEKKKIVLTERTRTQQENYQ